jgi:predicted small lipoprotein YifL
VQWQKNFATSGRLIFGTDGMTGSRILTGLVLLTALGAVASCGRKGDLDTPYTAAVEARKEAERAGEPVPPEPQKPVADKPFILDPLL